MSDPGPGSDPTAFVARCMEELGTSYVEGRIEGSALRSLLEQIRSREAMRDGLQSEGWLSAVELIQGALIAAEAGDRSAGDWDDRKINQTLEEVRALSTADAQRAFATVGAAILGGAGSDFIDMKPPNDEGDVVSSWLSGVLMLRRVVRRAREK